MKHIICTKPFRLFIVTLHNNEISFIVWELGGSHGHISTHYESQWAVMAVISAVNEQIEPEALTVLLCYGTT